MQKQLKITLNGKQYSIATDEHDQDILQAAELVDALFKARSEKMPTLSEDKIALMVALHIAIESTKAERVLHEDESKLAQVVLLLSGEV